MTESTDDILTRPLGVPEAPEPPAGRFERLVAVLRRPLVAGSAIAIALAGSVGLVLLLGDPQGGEPRVEAKITLREPSIRPAAPIPPAVDPQATAPASAASRLQRSAEELETASGVTVVRPAGSGPTDAVLIRGSGAGASRGAGSADQRDGTPRPFAEAR